MREILPLVFLLLGLFSGLFINWVVYRLYKHREMIDREQVEEVEEVGWLRCHLWPWKCKSFSLMLKIRIVCVNVLFGIISVWLWNWPPLNIEFWWGFLVLVYFGVVVVMDLEYRIVMYPVSIAGAIIGSGVGVYLHGIWDTILGGIVGFCFMFVMYWLGEMFSRRVSKVRGVEIDEVALGFGDVNISGVIGLLMGWPGIVTGLVLGVLAGGAVSFLYIVIRKVTGRYEAFDAIPYAPFLVFGAIMMIYFRYVFYWW